MTERLSAELLAELSAVKTPQYDRAGLARGIVHIGVGGFHRAHQAAYTEAVLESGDLRWGTAGVSLRSSNTREALLAQDCLYTVCTLHADRTDLRIHGGLVDMLHDPAVVIATIAAPDVHVVTLTVTEKAYSDDSSTGVPALLLEALRQRMQRGSGPLTILSCDNLLGNGRVLKKNVLERCEESGLSAWIDDQVGFPCSMVDRITPQTTDGDRDRVAELGGYLDTMPVVCEPFSQWFIENDFRTERPEWELGGAVLVGDVSPYEETKLRVLNATHSLFAYLGLLKGYQFIHEAVVDAELRNFVERVVRTEIAPTLEAPPGMEVETYAQDVLRRFANSAVPYGTNQVGSDGSQKILQRWIPTLEHLWRASLPAPGLELALCVWLKVLADWQRVDSISFTDDGAGNVQKYVLEADPSELLSVLSREVDPWRAMPEAAIKRMSAVYVDLCERGLSACLST